MVKTQESDDVTVEIEGYSENGEATVLGKATFPVQSLKDQFKHQQWFELHDSRTNELLEGRIHLSVQWIFAEEKYLEDLNAKVEVEIEGLNQDLNDYNVQLDAIYQLAPVLKNNNKLPQSPLHLNHSPIHRNDRTDFSPERKTSEPFLNQNKGFLLDFCKKLDFSNILNWGRKSITSSQIMSYTGLPDAEKKVLIFCGYGWLFISLLIMFDRSESIEVPFIHIS